MSKRWIKSGSTSQTIDIFVLNSSSTVGAGLTGLVFNSAGLSCYYRKGALGASTSVTLATLALITTPWATGGFKEVDATNMPGLYRFDIPNLALDTAGITVIYFKGATNMAPVVLEIEVVAVDVFDGVRMGLTSLPNAVAGAINGVPLSVAAGGAVNTLQINGTAQTARDIGASVLLSPGTGTGQLSLSAGAVTVGTNNDKSAYSLAASQTFNTTGSVGSVTSALGAAAVQSIWDRPTSNLTVLNSVGKLLVDNLNATVSSRSTLVATDVWSAATRTLTGNVTVGGFTAASITSAAFANSAINLRLANDPLTSNARFTTNDSFSGYPVLSNGPQFQIAITGAHHAAADVHEFQPNVLTSNATDATFIAEIGDGVLNRKLDSTGNGTDTLDERTVRSALRAMRNKVSVATGTMTVYKEDDSTIAWSGTVSNTSDVTVDPTG